MQHAAGQASRRGPSVLGVVVCAGLVFAALAGYMRVREAELGRGARAAGGEGRGDMPTSQAPPQIAEIGRAIAAMQLVTVMLETRVEVRTRDESWLGDVDATVRVPVRLFYGTDFSRARVDSVALGPLATAYLVRLPAPQRIATEVFPEREESNVETGWLRFRRIGGEYTLGLARRSIAEEARRMVLTLEDEEMIRERTRERVVELVRAIAGESASVRVAFDDRQAEAAPTEERP